ncbi:MAG: hypothetical protein IPM17_01825 [Verrucomicrobia bacterium]|nr:hypothetical protein [Verrucomicrobiota bacterium]
MHHSARALQRQLRHPLVLAIVAFWGAASAWAHTEQVLSVSVTNYTGYVIASDANAGLGPEYNRENIAARAEIRYTAQTATAATFFYRILFRLVDAAGNVVPIFDETGASNTVYRVSTSVRLPTTILGIPFSTRTLLHDAPLVPVGRLSPFTQYRVTVNMEKAASATGRYSAIAASGQDSLRTYYHFPSTVSNDPQRNVIAVLDGAAYQRTYLVNTVPGRDTLQVRADFTLRRYDAFAVAPATHNIPLRFTATLIDATSGQAVPLVQSNFTASRAVQTYLLAIIGNPVGPAVVTDSEVLNLRPVGQLDSPGRLYRVQVQLAHEETPLQPFVPANTVALANQRMLHFNGRLFFGDIATRVNALNNNPAPGAVGVNSVASTLGIPAGGGVIEGSPGHTYGTGAALPVVLRSNGNAEYTGAPSVAVSGPSPDTNAVANVRFQRSGMVLNTAGGFANFKVWLPSGFGIRPVPNSRITTGFLEFNNVKLVQNLRPASPDLVLASIFWGAEETKPVWIQGDELRWLVAGGRFVLKPTGRAEYVRSNELVRLSAAPVPAAQRFKRSNEQLFQAVRTVTSSTVEIRAHTDGSARLFADFDLGSGGFVTHFPYDSGVRHGGGVLSVKDDVVDSAGSKIVSVLPIKLQYARDCAEPLCSGGAGPATLEFKPDGEVLDMTRDGGLTRAGALTSAAPLNWGWIGLPAIQKYAHRTEPFTVSAYAMAGSFLRGDDTALNPLFRAAVLLFTGVGPADPGQVERPGRPAYQAGLGDYPGLNFRVGTDGAKQGESVLGGKATGLYPLRGRAKYYVRKAGVSGIHEAVFGAFPPTAQIYGYDFKFSNFGLAFLDSRNVDSRTQGSVSIKYPSDFTLAFEELKFTCLGALDDAKVAPGQENKELAFWQADFTPLAMKFDRKAAAACNPGEGFLTVGVKAWAQHVDAPLFGTLGWHPNGNLITRADNALDPPFDSRLKLPNTFQLKGPGTEKYTVTPVNDAYYNNWDYYKTAPGFINIAGKMDVPFFEDLKVHLHTSADKDGTGAPIYLMGGWPGKGFEIAGQNFFNANPADPDNRGFPTDTTVAGYRQGNTDNNLKYLVRAQRNWLGVVDFDYPLQWSTTTRAFTIFRPVTNKLLVVNVEHQAKYLSAKNAELKFGIEYEGMPNINLANMVFDQLGGVQNAFTGAVLGPARNALEAGMDRFNEMLQDQMHVFYDQAFDTLLDPVFKALYDQLKAIYVANGNAFPAGEPGNTIASFITGGGNSVVNRLNNLVDGAGPGQFDVVKQLDANLAQIEDALLKLDQILAKAPNGSRQIVAQLIKNLVGELAAQFVGAFVDSKLNEFLATLDPTLSQVEAALDELRGVVGDIRGALALPGNFRQQLKAQLNGLNAQVTAVANQVRNDVNGRFNQILNLGDNPFTHYSEAELRAFMRQKLEDRFFASVVAKTFQETIKHRLYDVEAAIREGVDSFFQQVNRVIRDVISESLAEVDNTINGLADDVNSVLGAGKINGYAHINGDALKLLRLDIYAQLKVPSEMEFNGFFQIKELDSDGTPAACLPTSGRATEVTMGATDVDVKWISDGLRANVGAKFTFDPAITPPRLINLGGGIELTGELSFETFKIKYLGASMGFGQLENFFSCAARVAINKYEGMGGIFFGKTCTLEPFFWDKDVQGILGTPPFTGAYVYVEVWIPVSEALLGIPATCLFQISAGVGAGAGYFVEGPTYVGKMLLGANGDVLCIVSVGGEIKLVGVKNADGLRLKGSGTLWGEIGWCPFCISFSKSVGLEYRNNSWKVDF